MDSTIFKQFYSVLLHRGKKSCKNIVFLFVTIILVMYGVSLSAQNAISKNTLDRVEKLLAHNEVNYADSLLRQEQYSFGNSNSSYREQYITGLLFYHKEMFEESISLMSAALINLDSLRAWNCDDYLKTAYYLADSYIHLNRLEEADKIINYTLVKCINSYSTCIYAKKIFQLLLTLYKSLDYSSAVIEQVHNEIQKNAINIYSSNESNKDGVKIRDHFMYFYNFITTPAISEVDSIDMNLGKAAYLYVIGEHEEAIRLYEKVKVKLSRYDQQLETINNSLLNMYSCTAQMDKIEKLLPEIYEYTSQMKLNYDPYMLNVLVGYKSNQNGHFRMAQLYYERCDSILNANPELSDWTEKKKNVLSQMVFNCRSLEAYDKIIKYCNEYEKISSTLDFDEQYFVLYHQGFAFRAKEKYSEAIQKLESLKTYLQSCSKNDDLYYVKTNILLGICYVCDNQNDKSIDCTSIALDLYKSLEIDNKLMLASIYNSLGRAYLQKYAYKKALELLAISAEIQIEQTGRVFEKTQKNIDECKKQEQ